MTQTAPEKNLKLIRLERIMDVVYALVIWRLFMILPRPEGGDDQSTSVLDLLVDNWQDFIVVLLALVIVIIFWLQNNKVMVSYVLLKF